MPKKVGRGEFKDEVAVLITLLNQVTDQQDASTFRSWMFYLISRILDGTEHFDWAMLISDCLHQQITNFLKYHEFHMISYLVYLVAFQGSYKHLKTNGTLGVQRVHEYYPQLEFSKSEQDFRAVNDHFSMRTVRDLDNEMHIRISAEAKSAMETWADWFIQFPTFTYIRVYGYVGEPLMLPRYPSDKIIFMEFLRQMQHVHFFLRNHHKTAATFPFALGIFTCSACDVPMRAPIGR